MKLEQTLTTETVNKNLLNVDYAVRGPIVHRAIQIERELQKGVPKPFKLVVRANLGDSHALGQPPFTFIRQVVALAAAPELMSSPEIPDDVKQRVRELLAGCTHGSVGAYSPSPGLRVVRESAAQYLRLRDGVAASADDVWLGNGASDVIKAVLTMFAGQVDGKPSAVMIPIPQYPLFSGTMSELGLQAAEYFLDEARGWALSPRELERSWGLAPERCTVRALVVINPGNPTGQVLSRENIEEIIKFAYDKRLFIMADEVYQENIVSKPFFSFKKVMHELGAPYCNMELASFITSSKGWAAEGGLRCGLVELLRLAPPTRALFSATRALAQCPNVLGQCVLDCIMRPPRAGDASFPQFWRELSRVRRSLAERTAQAVVTFNAIPGFSCNSIDGAMFAFPRVTLPARAQQAARTLNMAPDHFYCLRLLEETGICVVPGSGFGQEAGTFHFRTTILHPHDEFQHILDSIRCFHRNFLQHYAD